MLFFRQEPVSGIISPSHPQFGHSDTFCRNSPKNIQPFFKIQSPIQYRGPITSTNHHKTMFNTPIQNGNIMPYEFTHRYDHMAVCQNLVPLVNIKIAGKWVFIPLKMVLICIDPYLYLIIDITPLL